MKIAYIVTGTTKGLGKSLQDVLIQNDKDVFSINRRNLIDKKFKNFLLDLNNISQMEEKLHDELGGCFSECDLIVFVSNAAVLKPLKITSNLTVEEIQSSTHINFIAPIILLKFLLNQNKEVLAVNITSGAKDSKNKGLSLYSALKLGLYHFLEIANLENKKLNVMHFNPGLMDTDMQKLLRAKDTDFDRQKEFTEIYLNNGLKNTNNVALELYSKIENYIHENY